MRIETNIPPLPLLQPRPEASGRGIGADERARANSTPNARGEPGQRTSRAGDRVELSGNESRTTPSGEPLTPDQIRQVEKLEKRDAEVRAHEQAHVAAAGALFRGGPSYDLQTGPDGKRYAIGGTVQIDTSEGATPEETITKSQQIRRAALAPAEPSSTDRSVAAKATRMEAEARAELAEEQQADQAEVEESEASEEAATPSALGAKAIAEYQRSDASRPAIDTFG